jgi:CheY-like chemotaxis protein
MQTNADIAVHIWSYPAGRGADPGKVLVIGNNEGTRDVLAILTSIEGCEARVRPDGPDAHKEIVEWQPDLLLVDLDGLAQAADAVRTYRQTAGPQVPIVVLVGDLSPETAIAARSADHALTKPFAVVDLLHLLDQLVGCS